MYIYIYIYMNMWVVGFLYCLNLTDMNIRR